MLTVMVEQLVKDFSNLSLKTQKNKAKVKGMLAEQKDWLQSQILQEFVKIKHMIDTKTNRV
jgi:hypothetical protein